MGKIKKEKEILEQRLRSMGFVPQAGPSYLPTLAEMKSGPNVVFPGCDVMMPRDRSFTTESYAGDLNKGPEFTSTRNDETESLGPRIRSSSLGESAQDGRDLPTVKVSLCTCMSTSCHARFYLRCFCPTSSIKPLLRLLQSR